MRGFFWDYFHLVSLVAMPALCALLGLLNYLKNEFLSYVYLFFTVTYMLSGC